MAEHNKVGRRGEQFALEHLKAKGYEVLEQNWRFKHLEVDLIASFQNRIIIIEVKSRTSDTWGKPDDSVTNAKIKYLTEATEAYLTLNDFDKEIRFDIISILFKKNQVEKIVHLEEAFHPLIEE